MNQLRYAVIYGCPRSGTTFLADALRAVPNAESVIGTHLPITVPHLAGGGLLDGAEEALAFGFRHSLDNHLGTIVNSRLSALRRCLRGQSPLGDLWRAIRRRRQVDLLIYKEPFFALAPEFVYRALPECRLINIVRDGRDAANSLVDKYEVLSDAKLSTLSTAEAPVGRRVGERFVPWWVEEGRDQEFLAAHPYVRAIWMWKVMVRTCYNFAADPAVAASGRVLVLKYEDLVANPRAAAQAVVKHLGVAMNRRLEKQFSQAMNDSVGIYKKYRDPQLIRAAEHIARPELELYNYL